MDPRLLEAGRGLVADLDLEAVLERVLAAAAEITGARSRASAWAGCASGSSCSAASWRSPPASAAPASVRCCRRVGVGVDRVDDGGDDGERGQQAEHDDADHHEHAADGDERGLGDHDDPHGEDDEEEEAIASGGFTGHTGNVWPRERPALRALRGS